MARLPEETNALVHHIRTEKGFIDPRENASVSGARPPGCVPEAAAGGVGGGDGEGV